MYKFTQLFSMPPTSSSTGFVFANLITEAVVLYDHLYYVLSDDRTYYTCIGPEPEFDVDEVVIVDEINKKPVIHIGEAAFSECASLTSVTIPDSIVSIGYNAFSCCYSLTRINIPSSVTAIDAFAFLECTSLTSITIPDSVTYLGDCAFGGCSSLKTVSIGNGIIEMPEDLLAFCENVENLTIPFVGKYKDATTASRETLFGYIFGRDGGDKTIQKYGENDSDIYEYCIPKSIKNVTVVGGNILYGAFYGCTWIANIILPDKLSWIGSYALFRCSSLTSIIIPESVMSIGDYAFTTCYKLVEVYNLSSLRITAGSSDPSFIGKYAKVIHTSLDEQSVLEAVNDYIFMTWENEHYLMGYVGDSTKLTLPNTYKDNKYIIYDFAFCYRDDITQVTISNGVTKIRYDAFADCTSLASVTLGINVMSIDQGAFSECINLIEVYNLSPLNITVASNNHGGIGYYAKVIHTSLDEPSIVEIKED